MFHRLLRTFRCGVVRRPRLAVVGLIVFLLPNLRCFGEEPFRETIDSHVRAAWEREKVSPAPPADDAMFLRRIYLDLTGLIPTYEQAKAFLEDESKDKRARLVDELMKAPEYARHQADVWDRTVYFGRNPPGYKTRERDGFRRWLTEQFAQNTPYDKVAGAILRAEGNSVEHGAPMYLVQYDRKPADAAVAVTQDFLGIQLQCARCHDHPYEDWSQLDFYGMAAFFARLERVNVGKKDKETMVMIGEKNLGEIEFTGPAAEDEPGKKGKPVPAKFLHGDVLQEPELPEDFEEPRNFPNNKVPPAPRFSRKNQLADWVTSRENPYFARATVNRIWSQFMGRGLVHPVDNMSPFNSASHPGLLDAMTEAFVEHDFDVAWLIREIVSSQTYQLSSDGPVEEAKPQWFEQARVRPLAAEELLESWRIATGYDEALRRKNEVPDDRLHGLTWGYLRRYFGKPTNGVGDFQGGLHEHLYLNNGQLPKLLTRDEGGLLPILLDDKRPVEARVDRLFLSTLSRHPSPEEKSKFVEFLSTEEDKTRRAEEALWTLLTCSEFRFNH